MAVGEFQSQKLYKHTHAFYLVDTRHPSKRLTGCMYNGILIPILLPAHPIQFLYLADSRTRLDHRRQGKHQAQPIELNHGDDGQQASYALRETNGRE
jgi:hypothetical protein